MTLEHKYYSFDDMPEGYEFVRIRDTSRYRKVNGELEYYVDAKGDWSSTLIHISAQLPQFIPLPPEPKLYEKYLDGKWKLVLKAENGYPVLQVAFIQTAFGHKQTIKAAIPAINAFLEDICGKGL